MNETESWPLWWEVILHLSTDSVDACVHGDISGDAADYEAESWSLVVEHKFCKKQDKRAVKRQDVIYGMQMSELWNKTTVMCHFLTLSVFHVYKSAVTTYSCKKLEHKLYSMI